MTNEIIKKQTGATFEADAVRFIRPHEEQREGTFRLPTRALGAYGHIQILGFRLETELIPPNLVHVSITDPNNEEGDEVFILEPNNEKLPKEIADMMVNWHTELLQKGEG